MVEGAVPEVGGDGGGRPLVLLVDIMDEVIGLDMGLQEV